MPINRRNEIVLLVVVTLYLWLFSTGCAIHHSIKDTLNIKGTPDGNKIPLRVGLYLDSRFKESTLYYTNAHKILIGEGLVRGAEQAFSQVFKDIYFMSGSESSLSNCNVDVIARGFIEEKSIRVISEYRFLYTVKIKWIISDKEGKNLYINTIVGEGLSAGRFKNNFTECMTTAIEDHYSKLAYHLQTADWWKAISATDMK